MLYDQVVTHPAQLRLIGIPADKSRVVALESPRTDIEGGLLGLVQILEPEPDIDFETGNRVAMLLLTDDASALYARLRDAGVTMLGDLESYSERLGLTYAFTIEDPAGTRISFAEIVGSATE